MTNGTLSVARPRWLGVARAVWVVLAAAELVVFAASARAYWLQLNTICADPSRGDCSFTQPTPAVVEALQRLGITVGAYAGYTLIIHVAASLALLAVGFLVFWRRSDGWYGLFVSLLLVTFGAIGPSTVLYGAFEWAYPELVATIAVWNALSWLVFPGLGLFLVTFPDGRFVPRWSVAVVGLWIFQAIFFETIDALPPPLFAAELLLVWGSTLAVQVYRYRRVSDATQRQQTKWVLFGFAVGVSTIVVAGVLTLAFPGLGERGSTFRLLEGTWVALLFTPIPLSIGIAALKYRLWDIDPIVNRVLVYGALTACVVGLYVLVVGYLGAVFQTGGNLATSLVATGIVAVVFQPLRDRLQRGANRLMYGERDDPYGVISRLGRRLEGTLAPEAVLTAIVEDVSRALRLPQAGIWLTDGDVLRLGASHGEPPTRTTARDADAVERLRRAPDGLRPAGLDPSGEYGEALAEGDAALVLPLTHRGELVGALSLSPRGPGEEFSPADRRLLRDLATQTSAAAHAVRLTVALRFSLEDLRRSRERLVVAQEEERRRIQRDLHDGLGPVLASMRLRLEACLDAAQEAQGPTPETALAGDLERLYELVGQATDDIRRLVYDLRPPVLDQLGLVPAIRQHCERFHRETGIAVSFDAATDLPIPAAAEVALLRVAQEALLNVQKHASASRVNVRLAEEDGWLRLVVRDDGVGPDAAGHDGGTGIGSMRERADLLGGALRIGGGPEGGTEVAMLVPVGALGREEAR